MNGPGRRGPGFGLCFPGYWADKRTQSLSRKRATALFHRAMRQRERPHITLWRKRERVPAMLEMPNFPIYKDSVGNSVPD
jgi:hypothetical protein